MRMRLARGGIVLVDFFAVLWPKRTTLNSVDSVPIEVNHISPYMEYSASLEDLRYTKLENITWYLNIASHLVIVVVQVTSDFSRKTVRNSCTVNPLFFAHFVYVAPSQKLPVPLSSAYDVETLSTLFSVAGVVETHDLQPMFARLRRRAEHLDAIGAILYCTPARWRLADLMKRRSVLKPKMLYALPCRGKVVRRSLARGVPQIATDGKPLPAMPPELRAPIDDTAPLSEAGRRVTNALRRWWAKPTLPHCPVHSDIRSRAVLRRATNLR